MAQIKGNHQAFCSVAGEIYRWKHRHPKSKHVIITLEQAAIIQEEAAWVEQFRRTRREAAKANTNFKGKRLPDDQIKPASLERRKRREAAKEQADVS